MYLKSKEDFKYPLVYEVEATWDKYQVWNVRILELKKERCFDLGNFTSANVLDTSWRNVIFLPPK